MNAAKDLAASFGMDVKADLSFSGFPDNFDREAHRVINAEIQAKRGSALATLNEIG